jgi:group I intron endonuclease
LNEHGYIYLISNTVNDLVYVGLTSQQVKKRWVQHICDAKKGKGSTGSLHDAIRALGRDAFSVVLLEEHSSYVELRAAEKKWIANYDSFVNGYNGNPGGGGGNREPKSAEFKEYMRDLHKGKPKSQETKEALKVSSGVRWNRHLNSDFFPVVGQNIEGTRWTVVGSPVYRPTGSDGSKTAYIPVRCECGLEKESDWYGLKSGRSKQCRNCANRGITIARNKARKGQPVSEAAKRARAAGRRAYWAKRKAA